MKREISYSEGVQRSAAIVEHLEPHCETIRVAGSLRRERPRVSDIEIVCVPKVERDLFGEYDASQPHAVARALDAFEPIAPRLRSDGARIAWRERFFAGITIDEVAADVFCVLPPAQWGVIFAIRTGPALYSQYLVTRAREFGYRVKDGRLLNGADVVPTPDEQSFFGALRLEYAEPPARRAPWEFRKAYRANRPSK